MLIASDEADFSAISIVGILTEFSGEMKICIVSIRNPYHLTTTGSFQFGNIVGLGGEIDVITGKRMHKIPTAVVPTAHVVRGVTGHYAPGILHLPII